MGWIQTILTVMAVFVHAQSDSGCHTMLERTDGSRAPLVAEDGKPAVVFYEDRWSTAVNQQLKDELYSRGRTSGRLDRLHVVAVANIQHYNFFPARSIATAFIRAAETRAGIPILLDVDGMLSAPPWNLPRDGASVLVLDATGQEVFRHTGALDPEARERFFALLERLLGPAVAQ